MRAEERGKAWDRARLLFLTPQTLVNDIKQLICPCHKVKALTCSDRVSALLLTVSLPSCLL